ncbi:TetR/AcrR family transcriptional regulator [Mesorhizobium sp. B2-3-5]|uniref:TetR/AcrR family transcriptional regulator n=1 Tax=Mesorhizobium sp. B2-3-5 TaxID=2589958 RepID=UPI001126084F|nr:TetR/AcrR family transcriptional regulator [Mesorhizobium sp. B2-3-5]TPM26878.1 TetR/AcrR family transcriptional regulator [Mesorhizobium sp. B2-3-5]
MPRAKTNSVRKTKPAEQPKRRRLTHEARKNMILQEAIKFFSEVGFDGGTRDLALRMGVKQPLLYRFFPSKEDLVKNVYDAVYIGRWRHDWSRLIADRSLPLRERLIEFYEEYAEIMFQPEWIRIFLFSGLKGVDINKQYVPFMEENVLKRICEEIRQDNGLPTIEEVPITNQELAAFWVFHGGVFYYGVRREVYGVQVHTDVDEFIRLAVDGLLAGYPAVARKVLENQAGVKNRQSEIHQVDGTRSMTTAPKVGPKRALRKKAGA